MTIFPHSQPTFLHIIIPSWRLTVSMHQIGSLICNQYDKVQTDAQNESSVVTLYISWRTVVRHM